MKLRLSVPEDQFDSIPENLQEAYTLHTSGDNKGRYVLNFEKDDHGLSIVDPKKLQGSLEKERKATAKLKSELAAWKDGFSSFADEDGEPPTASSVLEKIRELEGKVKQGESRIDPDEVGPRIEAARMEIQKKLEAKEREAAALIQRIERQQMENALAQFISTDLAKDPKERLGLHPRAHRHLLNELMREAKFEHSEEGVSFRFYDGTGNMRYSEAGSADKPMSLAERISQMAEDEETALFFTKPAVESFDAQNRGGSPGTPRPQEVKVGQPGWITKAMSQPAKAPGHP